LNLWLSIRYSSTLPIRCVLAVAATIWALLFAFAPARITADPVYAFITSLAAAPVWSALFAVDAMLLTWRIFETRSRIGWSRIINACTCGLWMLYIVCSIEALGYLAPDIADDIAMMICAAWCTLRTDLTVSDRESA
jgi:hypothetical protein